MNIEGKDTKLRRVKTTEPQGALKQGHRLQKTYIAPRTKVQIDYVVDSVCTQDQECEVTGYDASITVTRNQRKQIVGSCGCFNSIDDSNAIALIKKEQQNLVTPLLP